MTHLGPKHAAKDRRNMEPTMGFVTEQGVDQHGPYWMCEPTKIAEWCERGGAP